MAPCCSEKEAKDNYGNCSLLQSAYVFAGLAMMLNIRLSYSSAPYALIRFRLPENLFSVFVRRMASALELWCLPSMLLGNIIDLFQKLYNGGPEIRAIIAKAASIKNHTTSINSKAANGSNQNLKEAAGGLNSAADALQKTPTVTNARAFKKKYDKFKEAYDKLGDAAQDKTAVQTYWTSLKGIIDGANLNPINKDWKFWSIIVPSIISQWLNFLTYVILFFVYGAGGDQGHLTTFYFVIAISGFVFGINMTLVYSVDFYYIPVYIAGENSFPIVTSFIHYLATLIFGNRRKYNSDFLIVLMDIWVAIIISLVAAWLWTYAYLCELVADSNKEVKYMKHIFAYGFEGKFHWNQLSPALMIVIGMGLVYAIYPGIAPGMIVPFYLVDKIEMVLLIATFFPPVIIAILRKYKENWSPSTQFLFSNFSMGGWTTYTDNEKTLVHAWLWHFFDILFVIKMILAGVFIFSLHYKDSAISRSIVNQPKMSTFLSITFYMCHEILLAVGFSGFIGNNGGDLILIPQYIGALFMIFLAFYSEGYIIEYKSHDPAHWQTHGMWYLYGYYQLNPDFLL